MIRDLPVEASAKARESTPEPEMVYRAMDRGKDEIVQALASGEEFFSEAEILSLFTAEQQAEIKQKQQTLSSLAYFIGKDFRIPVELGLPTKQCPSGWRQGKKRDGQEFLQMNAYDLLEKPMDFLRFITCHEGGHKRISRLEVIPLEEWKQPGFAFMMNAIEDTRDNNFVAESYPKFREQMGLAYTQDLDFERKAKEKAAQKLGYQPRFMQAGFEYIKQWFRETQGQEMELSADLPDDVKAVVLATIEAAKDSWWRYPSRQEADNGGKIEGNKIDGEAMITNYARVSYEINRDKIWPEFKKLVEKDLEDLKRAEIARDEDIERWENEGGALGKEKSATKTAAERLKEFEDALNEELQGKLSEDPGQKAVREQEQKGKEGEKRSPGDAPIRTGILQAEPLDMENMRAYKERLSRELNKDENIYEKYRKEVLPLIDQLEAELRQIFVDRKVTSWKGGFKSGKRIDIKRRIQEKARQVPAMESEAWQKRERPDEKDYSISLLVDLSGSMRENRKIDETFKAVIVLAEVLNRLGINLEIIGFNDEVYEYQNFGQPMSKQIREHMGGMFKEVEDSCCKNCGNEHSETDLGWATEVAAERLAKQKAEQRFLITLSDGKLAESSKHPKDKYEIKKTVKKILNNSDIHVIGLGVGKGTKNIETYYPKSISDINAKEMAEKLAGLIKEVIANYDKF